MPDLFAELFYGGGPAGGKESQHESSKSKRILLSITKRICEAPVDVFMDAKI
jgi:hypothetical protein